MLAGFVIAESIKGALDVIDANPTGVPVRQPVL